MSSNPPLQVPFKLIENTGRQKYPEFEKHRCAYMCSIMGEIHNCIFRALNSAYLNSERVKPGSPDVPNLLMFCHFVCQLMGAHHDWEETSYFPALEKFAGAPGLLKSNVEEHGTFEEPLSDFNAFCINPNTAKLYSPEKFRAMIDEFAPALGSHLHAEPETLYRLRHFDSTELEKVSEEQNKIVVAKGDSWTMLPIVLGNEENGKVIDGLQHSLHQFPWFLPYLVHYIFSRRYARVWRFNSSDYWGNIKKGDL